MSSAADIELIFTIRAFLSLFVNKTRDNQKLASVGTGPKWDWRDHVCICQWQRPTQKASSSDSVCVIVRFTWVFGAAGTSRQLCYGRLFRGVPLIVARGLCLWEMQTREEQVLTAVLAPDEDWAAMSKANA